MAISFKFNAPAFMRGIIVANWILNNLERQPFQPAEINYLLGKVSGSYFL